MMLLTELQVGDQLMVKSHYSQLLPQYDGDKYITFYTTCEKIFHNGILTNEIRTEDGYAIDFASKVVVSDVYYLPIGSTPILWKDVKIIRIQHENTYYHGMLAPKPGDKYNRRGSFRVPVTARAVARLGISKKTADVMVRDVSCTGFSIVINKQDGELKMRDNVRVTYMDEGEHCSLNGICVRRKKIDETKVIYGCTLEKRSKEISEYVARKQQRLMEKRPSRMEGTKEEKEPI